MIVTITPDAIGQKLSDWLVSQGHYITSPCGGRGVCGKCKVKLLSGYFCDTVTKDTVVPDDDGYILSCQVSCTKDSVGASISIPALEGGGLTDFVANANVGQKSGYAIALDIGTTTIGACLVDMNSGEVLCKTSMLNPQAVYGADVLSRIKVCSEGKLSILHSLIIDATNQIISKLSQGKSISELYVSANTTMLHLFLGVDPTPIGSYPFTPVFTLEQVLDGETLNLDVGVVKLMPSASAYIGSDVVVGVLASGMVGDATQVLVDMGTNGEIVLVHRGKTYATSTAVGPALEGACIECGMGGVAGAIDRVYLQNGNIYTHTIADAKPIGICGSGLIDLMALLLREGMIDETGAWQEDSDSPLANRLKGDKLYLTEDIYLSQKDIRQFQLAKSALYSGIETLLEDKEVSYEDIDALYIAGGIGYYMNLESATRVGLIPTQLSSVAKVVGNTSLAGTVRCLLSDLDREMVKNIARQIEVIDLSFSKVFGEKYIQNMYF